MPIYYTTNNRISHGKVLLIDKTQHAPAFAIFNPKDFLTVNSVLGQQLIYIFDVVSELIRLREQQITAHFVELNKFIKWYKNAK